MKTRSGIELLVGIFIISGIVALFVLAFKVSGWRGYAKRDAIVVYATFSEIGDLKIRAPVKIAGVRIGEVADIQLDKNNFEARVKMLIDKNNPLPIDSKAEILSASLLGSNYVIIDPGYAEEYIKNNGEITETHPAVILQRLIGQAIFTPKDEKK